METNPVTERHHVAPDVDVGIRERLKFIGGGWLN